MKIDDRLINRLGELSQLTLSDTEMMKRDLEKILDSMERLCELDTENILECSHPFDNVNVFRDDEVTQSLERVLVLKNAPNQELVFVPETAGEER